MVNDFYESDKKLKLQGVSNCMNFSKFSKLKVLSFNECLSNIAKV